MSSQTDSPAPGAVDVAVAEVRLAHSRREMRQASWKQSERVGTLPLLEEEAAARAKQAAPGIVRVEAWERHSWLRAGFSTRLGGQSSVYGKDDLNLGWTEADSQVAVAENRVRFLGAATAGAPFEMALLRQFHSNIVRHIDAAHGPLVTAEGKALLRGDALMTNLPGLLLGVQTADCVPVLVADTKRRVVAAFHAGWRGTLGRIVERGIGDFVLRYGSKRKHLVAAIGPCIGACCFAVGEEVRLEFESQFAYAVRLFSEVSDSSPVREKDSMLFLSARGPGHSNLGPQIHLDLVEANRQQLLGAGVPEANITVVSECTACTCVEIDRRKYFSHRREHGFTGRMMSVIGVLKE